MLLRLQIACPKVVTHFVGNTRGGARFCFMLFRHVYFKFWKRCKTKQEVWISVSLCWGGVHKLQKELSTLAIIRFSLFVIWDLCWPSARFSILFFCLLFLQQGTVRHYNFLMQDKNAAVHDARKIFILACTQHPTVQGPLTAVTSPVFLFMWLLQQVP